MKKTAVTLIFLAALAGSIFATLLQERLFAARNSSGTYSLYTPGNPVVTGTTISSTSFNNTMNDIATELTNSLDRSGRGAMLAPVKLPSGSAAAPSLEWSSDTNSGPYRSGSHDLRFSVNGTDVQKWTTAGLTTLVGLFATQSATDATALTATGNGGGAGGTFFGGLNGGNGIISKGLDGGYGILATGGEDGGTGVQGVGGVGPHAIGVAGRGGLDGGPGGSFTGVGAHNGVNGVGGGLDGNGVKGTGGATNGNGGWFLGTGTGVGLRADPGSTTVAIDSRGVIDLRNSTTPAYTDASGGVLSRINMVGCWATFTITGGSGGGNWTAGTPDGFNLKSVTRTNSTDIKITFADGAPMANTTYAPFVHILSSSGAVPQLTTQAKNTTDFNFNISFLGSGSVVDLDASTQTFTFSVQILGRQ